MSGDCTIALAANAVDSRDSFQEVAILQKAAMILNKCVKGLPSDQRFGGRVNIGPRRDFRVFVANGLSLRGSDDDSGMQWDSE